MMNRDDFDWLLTDEGRRTVRLHADRDPVEVALDRRLPHAAAVATQVKYLRRARRKLPSWAAAECLLLPRAYEQASSEAVAALKRIGGDTLLDLCCGMGVDAHHFARHFRRVVALERDPLTAAAARENFARLGIRNVEVVTASAEAYLAACTERFDWIYADPDRRDEAGRRQVRIEDCSPDLLALLPAIRRCSDRLAVKLSPLFDVDEAFRVLPGCRAEALSSEGECKELMLYADGGPSGTRGAEAVGGGRVCYAAGDLDPAPDPPFDPERMHWLVIPDAALHKMRLVRRTLRPGCCAESENGYGFAETKPEGLPLCRICEIDRIEPYDPGRLKKELKGVRAEILKRDFPFSTAEILRRTGLREGDAVRIAFTRAAGRCWMIRLK